MMIGKREAVVQLKKGLKKHKKDEAVQQVIEKKKAELKKIPKKKVESSSSSEDSDSDDETKVCGYILWGLVVMYFDDYMGRILSLL